MEYEGLKQILSGDVATDAETIRTYSRDASIFKYLPKAVVFPKDTEDVRKLVAFVAQEKKNHPELSVTARSAGTDMTGGPLSESIVVGFTKYLNHFSIEGETAMIEPGVYYRDFEKESLARGLVMPSYPASKSLAALGGIVNNNSGGEKTLRYGKTSKYVEEMSMVLSDGNSYTFGPLSREALEAKKAQQDFEGELYRCVHDLIEKNYDAIQTARPHVAKNSAGYALWDIWDRETGIFDMTKLFVGGQGTLGIMTQAKLKLVRVKTKTRLAVLFFKGIGRLPQVVNKLLPLHPESLEVFDDKTLMLAFRFFPEIAKRAGENLISFAWKFLPEAIIGMEMLGMPKLVVLVEFAEDTDGEVEKKLSELDKVIKTFHVPHRLIHDPHDAEKYWIIRRESFNLLRQHVKNKSATPFVDDFIVEPKYLPEVLPKVYEVLKAYGIKGTLAGHAGSGNFHIIPLMDLSKESERNKIGPVSETIYDLVLKHGGSTTAEHGDGLIRGAYLEKMFGPDVYNLFVEIKHIFDPQNIFNPGKKIGVDFKKALEHINQEG